MAGTGVASGAKKSVGTLLKMQDDNSPAVFNTIGDVTGITPSEPKFSEIDITHFNSPVDSNGIQYAEFLFGILDPGSIAVTVNFTGLNDQDEVIAAGGKLKEFELHFPQLITPTWTAGVKVTFSAYVGYLMPQPEMKGTIKASLTLRVSGAYTFTALS